MILMIDIGGTNIKYGVIDSGSENYELLGELATETEKENFRMEKRLEKIVDRVMEDYSLEGIAISTAGIVDEEKGKIVYANENIPNYKGTDLKGILEEQYKLPVTVENDVNSALLGEIHFGDYKNVHSALMITIGTGVGGALYLNNQIHHGFSHSGGEIGYSLINGKNIERLASTRALVDRVANELADDKVDGRWIFEQAIHEKNPLAIKEIDVLVNELAQLINNNVALLNPEYVILGGGIMEQVDYLKDRIIKKFEELNKNKLVANETKIEFASLGNKAGMLGAYVHFKESSRNNE